MRQNSNGKQGEKKMHVQKKLKISGGSKAVSKVVVRNDDMNELPNEDLLEKLGSLDQIRDIILGPQLREYNRRFEKIESDLLAFQEEMQGRINEAQNALSQELRIAIESLTKKIRSLGVITQEECRDLRQQLEHTDRKFSNSLKTFSVEVDTNITSLQEGLSQTRGKLQEDMRNFKAQVHEELDKRFSAFGDIKVSRDDIVEILFELGVRLKGVEFVPDLNYLPIV